MSEPLNPYMLPARDMTDRKTYFGRDKQFEDLYYGVRNGKNTVVMGPHGTGKTQFLNCAFNEAKRLELAEERILVSRLYNGISGDPDAFFRAVAASLLDDADILLEVEDQESVYSALTKKAKALRDTETNGQGYLEGLCKFFMRKGYTVYVVIDCFEQFVNSRHITKEHHNVLRNFLANTTLRLVVATDYDFNKSTLPREAAGSLLLQLFSGNELTLPGLTPEECGAFLASLSGREDFTPAEVMSLYHISGGVPQLLCQGAALAWEQKNRTGTLDGPGWNRVLHNLLASQRTLLEAWTRHLDAREIALLQDRAAGGQLAAINKDEWDGAVDRLLQRGLLRDLSDSKVIELRHMYPISAMTLALYCREETLEAFADPEDKPQVIQEIHHHYEAGSKVYEAGATDNSQTLNADNVVISNGISLPELVHWIADPDTAGLPTSQFQQYLGTRLQDRFHGFLEQFPMPQRGAETEDEYAILCDRHFSTMAGKMLPDISVNEDNEPELDVDAQELVTIDQRFEAVRSRRPALTDALLATQSERCQIYVKLSVIVEDALAIVGRFMEDYSPQLVLYGKALEQCLRDNLFPYFSQNDTIRTWDTFRRVYDPDSPNAFCNMDRDLSFIGNYIYMMRAQRTYLSNRCVSCNVSLGGGTKNLYEWKGWWLDLISDAAEAKTIRDKADHASDTPPVQEDLDAICKLLFGTEEAAGVLERLTVGAMLHLQEQAQANAQNISAMENTVQQVRIQKVKTGSALDCTTVSGGCTVKISKSAVAKYIALHPDFVPAEGMILMASLGLYELQDGSTFFHGTLA